MSKNSFDINDEENQKFLKTYGLDKKSLVEYKSKIPKADQEERIELAIKIHDCISEEIYPSDKIIRYVKEGADVNRCDRNGNSLLIKCVIFEWLWAAIELIKAGADVNAQCLDGDTALMCIASNTECDSSVPALDFARILILFGADISAKNDKGETALMLAKMCGNDEIYNLLLDAEISKNIVPFNNDEMNNLVLDVETSNNLGPFSNDKKQAKIVTDDDIKALIDEATLNLEKSKRFKLF